MKLISATQPAQRTSTGPGRAATREKGATSILTTLVAVILLGSLGFAVDLGNAMQMQRKAQNAADSAAFAGVAEYDKQIAYEQSQAGGAPLNTAARTRAKTAAIAEAKRYADRNFPVSASAWNGCTDPNRPLTYEVMSGYSDCLSISTAATTKIRVRIPVDVNTTFGRVLGTNMIQADGAAIIGSNVTTTTTTTTTTIAPTTTVAGSPTTTPNATTTTNPITYGSTCATNPLGNVTPFNVWTTNGNFSYVPDVEGRVAVSGNAVLQNFSIGHSPSSGWALVGAQLPNDPNRIDLYVGGTLSMSSGGFPNGSVKAVGAINQSSITYVSGGSATTGSGPDYAAERTNLTALKSYWAGLTATGTVTARGQSWEGYALNGTRTDYNVFNMTVAQLASSGGLRFNVPTGSTVLVNVPGTSIDLNAGISPADLNGASQNNILFNFYQATSLSIGRTAWSGTIFAPDADFTVGFNIPQGEGAAYNGALIVKSFTQPSSNPHGEPHNFPFTGCLPVQQVSATTTTTTAAPTTTVAPTTTAAATTTTTRATTTTTTTTAAPTTTTTTTTTTIPGPTTSLPVNPTPLCSTTNLIVNNPSFESGLTGWTVVGSASTMTGIAAPGTGVRTGWVQKTTGSEGSLTQTVAATAGKTYETTFYGGTHDPTNNAKISMAFLNSSGTVLGEYAYDMNVDVDLPPYQVGGPFRFNKVAPAGTTQVRVKAWVTNWDYVKIDHVSIIACL